MSETGEHVDQADAYPRPRRPTEATAGGSGRAELPLVLLRSFVTTAEVGSITGAARLLHCSVSAVSMHITALEDRIGARLLQRDRRGCPLTAAGLRAYPCISRLLAETGELTETVYASVRRPGAGH